ncbi:hypothetical protein Hypma_004529 [Hypsizygus marmoreus]|uniref:Uncharacterized protein n=1 Tax=Hypsizygus marmoreus TaxID=39966 RepID=A0A369K692_HYPMA|nr:hypothetical protein Hypma_004529 [Hypsizygus marmoreus]
MYQDEKRRDSGLKINKNRNRKIKQEFSISGFPDAQITELEGDEPDWRRIKRYLDDVIYFFTASVCSATKVGVFEVEVIFLRAWKMMSGSRTLPIRNTSKRGQRMSESMRGSTSSTLAKKLTFSRSIALVEY